MTKNNTCVMAYLLALAALLAACAGSPPTSTVGPVKASAPTFAPKPPAAIATPSGNVPAVPWIRLSIAPFVVGADAEFLLRTHQLQDIRVEPGFKLAATVLWAQNTSAE